MENLSKISWREAATGGLLLGLALCASMVLAYLIREQSALAWLPGALDFVFLGGFIMAYGRRMGAHYGPRGYSFVQSIGFSLRLMLFAGVIAGLSQFVLQTYVDPDYYRGVVETTYRALDTEVPRDQLDQALTNPVIMAISGALSMLIYGGLIGVVLSAFLKRPAQPLPPEEETHCENNETHE